MMDKIQFLLEGIKNIKTVGTLTRSSRFLCSKIVSLANLRGSKCIVELGAGEGVMTKHILDNMPVDATLFAFEIHPKFCERLRRIKDPRLHVIHDSAENLKNHLSENGFSQIDTVFSALPFVMLPRELAKKIVSSCHQNLNHWGNTFKFIILCWRKIFTRVFLARSM